jgi:hypothetical protein
VLSYLGVKRNPIVLIVAGIAVIVIGVIKGTVLALAIGALIIVFGVVRFFMGG